MEIARLLLERGAQPNMADKVGYFYNITMSFGGMFLWYYLWLLTIHFLMGTGNALHYQLKIVE